MATEKTHSAEQIIDIRQTERETNQERRLPRRAARSVSASGALPVASKVWRDGEKRRKTARSWRRKTPDSETAGRGELDNDILKEALKTSSDAQHRRDAVNRVRRDWASVKGGSVGASQPEHATVPTSAPEAG